MQNLGLPEKNNHLENKFQNYPLNKFKNSAYETIKFDEVILAKILNFVTTELKSNLFNEEYENNQYLGKVERLKGERNLGPYRANTHQIFEKAHNIQDLEKLINGVEDLDYNAIMADLDDGTISESSIFLLNHQDQILNFLGEKEYQLNHFSDTQKLALEQLFSKLQEEAKDL